MLLVKIYTLYAVCMHTNMCIRITAHLLNCTCKCNTHVFIYSLYDIYNLLIIDDRRPVNMADNNS